MRFLISRAPRLVLETLEPWTSKTYFSNWKYNFFDKTKRLLAGINTQNQLENQHFEQKLLIIEINSWGLRKLKLLQKVLFGATWSLNLCTFGAPRSLNYYKNQCLELQQVEAINYKNMHVKPQGAQIITKITIWRYGEQQQHKKILLKVCFSI